MDDDKAVGMATDAKPLPMVLTDDQVKHMVERFLRWRLPENFQPDAGITFKADFNEHTSHPMKHEPVGTNLFSFAQAEEMVRHMLVDLPTTPPEGAGRFAPRAALTAHRGDKTQAIGAEGAA